MSTRKIIFLAILGVILWSGIIAIIFLWSKDTTKTSIPETLTIWITDGSTESYSKVIDGFKTYAPEYRKMQIHVEKKTSDPIRFRTLFLNTLTDGTGPDLFMLTSWSDKVLEWKREPIPNTVIATDQFEREYEDVFMELLTGSTDEKDTSTYLLWLPIGYETLGIFYNKALVREVPKTWDDVEGLYSKELGWDIYPTNLWLGPRYTPNASDIIAIFDSHKNGTYNDVAENPGPLWKYLAFKNIWLASTSSNNAEEDIYAPRKTISGLETLLEENKKTTFDAFMQGDIALIFWYPSIVTELEKSKKRAWINSAENLILTAPIPQDTTNGNKKNLARYSYLSISKLSKNPTAWAKFLEYLMTDDAIRSLQTAYPYLLPPKPSLYEAWSTHSLSDILTRAKLDAFIPAIDEELNLFDYGLRAEFDIFLSENIDRIENIDISNIWSRLVTSIDCGLWLYLGTPSQECEKKE